MVEQTSIERFLRNRGAMLGGRLGASRRGFFIQMYVGGALIGVAGILWIVALVTHVPEVLYGSLGPTIAGSTNVLVGALLLAKLKNRLPATEVKASPEAKALLGELMRQTGSSGFEWYDASNHSLAPIQRSMAHRAQARRFMFGYKKPQELLSHPLFDLLERACYQYNRICGIVESAPDGGPVKKLAASAMTGADESILDVFHQGAMISRYPESTASAVQITESRISALTELGDRLEGLQARQPALSDRLSAGSAMERVLEDLKLDDLARSELQAPLNEEDVQRRLSH